MSEDQRPIRVQLCYAKPDNILLEELKVQSGTTLEQAVRMSGIFAQVPEIDLYSCKVGIYGKLKPLDTVLRASDRIEIYRSLLADPKDARRRRAVKKEKAS
ncbi:hypothetical protein EDC30_101471 [Paucimonas lemoignei]|uniref:UPF0125 protein EDC30_101471 n=1 Tax=Paucimonas lemoignei TaxID=29443 RepID=A0A4R3I468_PAULE|nr:RnfH family protein [Paucimonas lemoignei]TCS39515.1 hypothetical protein EDC30_101471 [Paucimonas lemoignei]